MKRSLFLVSLLASALVVGCMKHKPKGPPPKPVRFALANDVTLRADDSDEAPAVTELKKGAIVDVTKTTNRWLAVTTTAHETGFVKRAKASYRTAVFGTDGFYYTPEVVDRLRRIPALEVMHVERTTRLMPATPAGGVAGAEQLAGGLDADFVVGVTGGGRQFVFEMVDMRSHRVVLKGLTHETAYLKSAVNDLGDQIQNAVTIAEGQTIAPAFAVPTATPEGGAATPAATPTPTPEPRHPNAPLPVHDSDATPAPSESPSPSPTASPH